MEKESKIKISILIFFYTAYLTTLRGLQKMKTHALIGAEKSVTECFVRKKEKLINKGTDKQCFNTQYNISYPSFVLNFKIHCQVVH